MLFLYRLLDFTIMCSIVNILAAILVTMNSVGLEIFSRMCSYNVAQDPDNWRKYCGAGCVLLMIDQSLLTLFIF